MTAVEKSPRLCISAGTAAFATQRVAETLASWAAAYVVDPNRFHCVGQEINANHVRAVSEGWVYAEARPRHIEKKSHVWEVKIKNENGQLVCISRVTMAVLERPIQY